jgi:hypothetical protein
MLRGPAHTVKFLCANDRRDVRPKTRRVLRESTSLLSFSKDLAEAILAAIDNNCLSSDECSIVAR